jgi:hypothetical protein
LVKAREALDAVGRVSRVGRVSVLREYERPYNGVMSASVYNKHEVGSCIEAAMLLIAWRGIIR